MTIECDLYLRLSDFRDGDDGFGTREHNLRAMADRLGWHVHRVVIENDLMKPPRNGNGRSRPASAFKRRLMITPSGRTELRVDRPGFRSILDDLTSGRVKALLAEDLDRMMRDPRDLEDLVDAMAGCRGHARSLSGSLTFTNGGTDSEITMARVMVTMANKSSRDTARRVAASRKSRAGEGRWGGGGRRPYGYQPAGKGVLEIVAEEATVLREAASAVLAQVTLAAIARDLRACGVPTVTGATWSARIVRDVLLKPAVAGLAAHTAEDEDGTPVTTLYEAAWEPILDRSTWEAVRAILDDPSRRTNAGTEPRWLGTGIYLCGVCGTPSLNVSGGKAKGPGYVCRENAHLRRVAVPADAWVAEQICERLARDDAADLLLPAAAEGATADPAALRQQEAALRARKKALAVAFAADDDADALAAGIAAINAQLDRVRADLTAATAPDPLKEFRGDVDPYAVWEGLPLARKREVARTLVKVTILPLTRRGRGFDPESVRVEFAA